MKKLTPKQNDFVIGLLKGMSQRQAYKMAYEADNMKNETIDKRASELFKRENIQLVYGQLIRERQKTIIKNT